MSKRKDSAISPRFFREFRDVDDFVNEYGFHQWRFNVDIPDGARRSWLEAFRAWVGELDVIEAARVNRLLELGRVQETLVAARTAGADDQMSWASRVKISDKKTFEFIVGDFVDPEPFEPWADALPRIRESRPGSFRYKATVHGLCELLRPLFSVSPAVYIIDPYFFPCAGNEIEFLRKLLREIRGTSCFQVHVLTRDLYRANKAEYKKVIFEQSPPAPTDATSFSLRIQELFNEHVGPERSLHIHLVDDRPRGSQSLRLHHRFVLGKSGGIRLDKGLTMTGDFEEAIVVARNDHSEKLRLYTDHVVQFENNLPVREGQKRPFSVASMIVKH